MKVTDYTTTDITAKAIQELMVTMETEILVPILKRCMNDKQVFEILLIETMFNLPFSHYKLLLYFKSLNVRTKLLGKEKHV